MMEGFMLGPALKELLVDLDRRKGKLSRFERAIHRELVGILLADHFEASISDVVGTRARPSVIGRRFKAVEVPADYLGSTSFRNAMLPMLGDAQHLRVDVDLSGGDPDNPSQLQIGCGEPKCKYKEPEPGP
jgi:hypothetical protein